MDNETPVTKSDLAALETKMEDGFTAVYANFEAIEKRFAAVDERLEMLRTETGHQFDDLKETMRDNQTEVLKAFYNFALTNNKRHAQTEVNEVALRSRMDTIEQRLLEVEHRLNIPPAA